MSKNAEYEEAYNSYKELVYAGGEPVSPDGGTTVYRGYPPGS
jgi:hypothetical protein